MRRDGFAFRQRSVLLVLLALVMLGCGGQATGDGVARITALEERMVQWMDGSGELDWSSDEVQDVVGQLLRGYAEYANGHHGDSLAGVYRMRRAELLLGKGDASAAIDQWVDVVEGHPTTPWAAEAMFRVGFTRETALADTVGALEAYSGLIGAFPESPWAEQARQASAWLTFNEREMIRSLREGS